MKILLIFYFVCWISYSSQLGEFLANCPVTHIAPNDPLVFPGVPGASHMHTFFGSIGINAFSNVTTMMEAGTSCDVIGDKSGYWVPTLQRFINKRQTLENIIERQVCPCECCSNIPIPTPTPTPIPTPTPTPTPSPNTTIQYIVPDRATFYYHTFNHFDIVQPMPVGLSIISRVYKFSCQGSDISGLTIVDCTPNLLELLINFPDCWDGINLYLSDQSHMVYSEDDLCFPSHPIKVPRLQFKLRYPVSGGSEFTLSSDGEDGDGSTAHADFVNGWEPEAMLARVIQCSRTDTKCDPNI